MAQDQRQHRPGRRGGPGVHEVDPQAADRDTEAREPGQRRLLRRRVEPVRPVGDELAEVSQVSPQRPPGVLGCVRPARRAQPRAEVLQRPRGGLRDERVGAQRHIRHARHPTGRADPVPWSGRSWPRPAPGPPAPAGGRAGRKTDPGSTGMSRKPIAASNRARLLPNSRPISPPATTVARTTSAGPTRNPGHRHGRQLE